MDDVARRAYLRGAASADEIDTLWKISTSIVVFLMQFGFALVEAGIIAVVRIKDRFSTPSAGGWRVRRAKVGTRQERKAAARCARRPLCMAPWPHGPTSAGPCTCRT